MTIAERVLAWVVVTGIVVLAALLSTHSPARSQASTAIPCTAKAIYDASTSGSTRLIVAPTNNRSILICGYTFFAVGTVNVGLNYGTGTNCGTGTIALTPAFQFTAQSGIAEPATAYRGMNAPTGADVCLNTSAGIAVQAIVYYTVR